MKRITTLKTILCISIAGLLFSGYLSYSELIQNVCALGECSYLLGFPICVYGFLMYLAIFIITILGIKSKN